MVWKGIYFGFTYPESKKLLKSNVSELTNLTINNIKSAQKIYNWWINRWAEQRFNNLNNNNKLNKNWKYIFNKLLLNNYNKLSYLLFRFLP